MKRRFVVQRHDVRPGEVHFDFMVERGEKLATWRLPASLEGASELEGERSFDHRRVYLEYEGEVSGNRGRVTIAERGELEDREGDPDASRWVFAIASRLHELSSSEGGKVVVRRLA